MHVPVLGQHGLSAVQVPAHPAGPFTHRPRRQVVPLSHSTPHAPQFWLSVRMSAQRPSQNE
jgi:hypothetical protein